MYCVLKSALWEEIFAFQKPDIDLQVVLSGIMSNEYLPEECLLQFHILRLHQDPFRPKCMYIKWCDEQ